MLSRKKIVLVAKDVIKQVKRAKLVVKPGTYAQAIVDDVRGYSWQDVVEADGLLKARDLQDIMKAENATCHVCARGALVMAKANLFNSCPIPSLAGTHYSAEKFSRLEFPKDIWARAEAAFEGFDEGINLNDAEEAESNDYDCLEILSIKERKACLKFYYKYQDETKRLLAIMRNIIRNEGRFVPQGLEK